MKRRDFLGSCAVLSGMAAMARADAATDDAQVRRYTRSLLVDIHGQPIRQGALAAETNYVYQYPFASTPCFLLRLPEGTYSIEAERNGEVKTRKFDVVAGRHQAIALSWAG